jgi:hypothetical protein
MEIDTAAQAFRKIADLAVKASQIVPNPEAETVLLWADQGAIVRFTQDGDQYESIAVESEKHGVYAYWAPEFNPVFLDCKEEDFEKFFSSLTV